MSENKRFTLKHYEDTDWAYDNGKSIYTKEMVELLNEQEETIQSLTKDKKYFLKVIFAMGNYAEKEDYERIIDARDKVLEMILNDKE